MDLHCKKCLTGRTGDVLGGKCPTGGCTGIIEESPAYFTLVDVLPEPMTCGRRFNGDKDLDRWEKFKVNGDRVCSYCGSLHPEDLFAIVKASAEAPEDAEYGTVPEIEPSDKSYKIYVKQPGVRNAHEGGIKFYTQHLVKDAHGLAVTPEQNDEYRRATRATKIRFARRLEQLRNECGPTKQTSS